MVTRAVVATSMLLIAFVLPSHAASGDQCVARARYVEGEVGGLGDASFFATFAITPDKKRCSEGCKGTLRFKLSYTGKNGALEFFEPAGSLEWESNDTDEVEEVATIVWPRCTRRIGDVKTTPCTLNKGYVIRVTCEQL